MDCHLDSDRIVAAVSTGGHKGYGLALVGELVADAMLGPATTEGNWLLIAVATARFRAPGALQSAAEAVLAELRACPPAPGFERVEIPGERERIHRDAAQGVLAIPERTWNQIKRLAETLNGEMGDNAGPT